VRRLDGVETLERLAHAGRATAVRGDSPRDARVEAFTHGNTCLAEGKFADAIAAFQRARELDPKRLHVADRLAEAERRQAAASPPPTAIAS
jgi:predicted Zn-dependent protease